MCAEDNIGEGTRDPLPLLDSRKKTFEGGGVGNAYLDQVRCRAGDGMTFKDLLSRAALTPKGIILRTGIDVDEDESGNVETGGIGIDLCCIALDHAIGFETLDVVTDGRDRRTDLFSDLAETESGILLEESTDRTVKVLQCWHCITFVKFFDDKLNVR